MNEEDGAYRQKGKEVKYTEQEYIDSEFYGLDEDIGCYKAKVVKCRKPHKCVCCESEITIGEYAFYENGFMDSEPVSCYTCLSCMDKWLDEINGCED